MSEFKKIDENLYSRQIAVYGKNAMKNLTDANVLIIGFDGSCLELCKNLILAGVGNIYLNDSSILQLDDLSTNYYANENDIGKLNCDIIKDKLSELNPYVKFNVINEPNKFARNYDVLILVNGEYEDAKFYDKSCSEKNKGFIWMNTYGLLANIFCNFNNFVTKDSDGENASISIIQEITSDGIFTTVEPHGMYSNDKFLINDVKGIKDINDKILTINNVISPNTFKVNDINLDGYESGGRVIQQKEELEINHQPLEKQINEPILVNLDEEYYQLHDLFSNFIQKKEIKSLSKYKHEFYRTYNEKFIPVCSIIGSYASQEVIKAITKKYTPTNQWFYYHAYDTIPEYINIDFEEKNDRYDSMRRIFGNKNINKIRGSSYFIIGSGAIGCEHLKNFVMCGIGSKDSQIYITDMDTIEKSNLNRQFLFRNGDIGKLKSDIAAREAMKMNPSVVVTSHQNKVCQETEIVYDNEFFKSIDGVSNALDNVQARLYVDQRCIFYDKPLFESGTLGTKGNTQVIIPRVTEHYGASQDPQEKSFPVCTIKNFPNTIEHTIHWARNEFDELFTTNPNTWNKYLDDPTYLNKVTNNEKGEMIHNIMYLWDNRVYNFEDCIKFSINRFYDKYNNMIKQLLHAYPKDTETTSGVKFWSGSKRCPKSIESIDIDYVYHTSLLVAKMFNINISNNEKVIDIITNVITLYKPPKYEPSDDIKVSANDKEEKENAKSRYESLDVSLLPDISEMKKFNINSIEFEKDDDTNHHIDFIKCSSNLRATNYDIPVADRYETKIKAGKIIPAISTTTSLVSGLVTIEMIKYILGKRKIEDFKNTFLNLGLSLVAQSEPMPTTVTKIKDKNITIWDYYNLYDDLKVSDLLEKLSEEYKLEIDTISYGSKLLISPMTGPLLKIKRQEMKLSQLLQEFNVVLENNIYELQISSLFDEEECEPPNVKFHYTTWSLVQESVI